MATNYLLVFAFAFAIAGFPPAVQSRKLMLKRSDVDNADIENQGSDNQAKQNGQKTEQQAINEQFGDRSNSLLSKNKQSSESLSLSGPAGHSLRSQHKKPDNKDSVDDDGVVDPELKWGEGEDNLPSEAPKIKQQSQIGGSQKILVKLSQINPDVEKGGSLLGQSNSDSDNNFDNGQHDSFINTNFQNNDNSNKINSFQMIQKQQQPPTKYNKYQQRGGLQKGGLRLKQNNKNKSCNCCKSCLKNCVNKHQKNKQNRKKYHETCTYECCGKQICPFKCCLNNKDCCVCTNQGFRSAIRKFAFYSIILSGLVYITFSNSPGQAWEDQLEYGFGLATVLTVVYYILKNSSSACFEKVQQCLYGKGDCDLGCMDATCEFCARSLGITGKDQKKKEIKKGK